jgi:hypothetical protein
MYIQDMKTTTMAKGNRATAERIVRAGDEFVAVLMSLGGISKDDAERVFEHYRKIRVAKVDSVIGRVDVKDGAFLDREVIRRAVDANGR